jgi:hypothetical protein
MSLVSLDVTGTSLVMAQEYAEDIAGLEMSPN